MTAHSAHEEMSTTYDPSEVEQRIYRGWEEAGYFKPQGGERPFTIIMPPPNLTGELHMGHALTAAVEDALTRWHRMLGDNALWMAGTDHAGIATQAVVEKDLLAKDGKSREDLGRDAFLERVWEWKEKHGDATLEQLKRLGASCDWSRTRFTLDPEMSLAVRTAFVRLW